MENTKRIYDLLKKGARKMGLIKVGHGEKGIREVGHRNYVGGLWEEIGRLQFEFLLKEGVTPVCYFLDIGCGCLRLGVHMIPYLRRGRYFGVDKEESLIRMGIENELGLDWWHQKQPVILIDQDFPFHRLPKKPQVAWSHSLFTHLTPDRIELCLGHLRSSIDPQGYFYASFFESDKEIRNPKRPHDHKNFLYTRYEMERFGANTGWQSEYYGEWGHPRGQVIIRFTPMESGEEDRAESA
jgi:hypothetical protein